MEKIIIKNYTNDNKVAQRVFIYFDAFKKAILKKKKYGWYHGIIYHLSLEEIEYPVFVYKTENNTIVIEIGERNAN